MKFKVKPYENYIVLYPGTCVFKEVFEAGSIIEIEDIDNDIQKCKLELCTEEDLKSIIPEKKEDVLDVFDTTPIIPVAVSVSLEEKRKAAQDKLRAGSN